MRGKVKLQSRPQRKDAEGEKSETNTRKANIYYLFGLTFKPALFSVQYGMCDKNAPKNEIKKKMVFFAFTLGAFFCIEYVG